MFPKNIETAQAKRASGHRCWDINRMEAIPPITWAIRLDILCPFIGLFSSCALDRLLRQPEDCSRCCSSGFLLPSSEDRST